MYRAIFIFDIHDLLIELDGAIVALRHRVPELINTRPETLRKMWIYNHLWQDVHLALKPDNDIVEVRSRVDYKYYNFNQRLISRLVRHVGVALYPDNNPYYHHPCSIAITKRDLEIRFDFGPVDPTKFY